MHCLRVIFTVITIIYRYSLAKLNMNSPRRLFYFSFPIYAFNKSIGIGKIVVVLCSDEISTRVCRYLNVSALGWLSNISAASASRCEAWNSPSAEMTFDLLSLSASACRAMALCISCGRFICFSSTLETFIPQGSV